MLSLELCKALKDAGFPQPRLKKFIQWGGGWYKSSLKKLKWSLEVRPHKPTLPELIEACGEGFMGIRRSQDGTFFAVKSDGHIMEDYPTPEEAVANLYLVLNKK